LSVNDLEECLAAASKDAGVINLFLWALADKSHVLRRKTHFALFKLASFTHK
jgi:hypothetical protein